MKRFFIMLVLLLSVVISGCSDKIAPKDLSPATITIEDKASTSANDRYEIEKASYTEKNVKITYPQLNKLGDTSKQNKINQLIQTEALGVLDNYKDNISNLDLNMEFEIKYQGTDYLSIQYRGLAVVKAVAYPVHLLHTTNIDLAKEKSLALSDVVTVNNSFIEKFKASKYRTYSSDLNLESAGALNDVLNSLGSNNLMDSFKQRTAEFYFTKDSLGVSVEVVHAVGDHMEMEMAYKDLTGLLQLKPDLK
ncbi:MAG: hypothetical protein CVU90_05065 [Firmicutes bacterium HGW-Firmicutes-15]|nr:MAG: hypothetical protein CVU90_05065 [Firmicutes bacterium HGW-Firmicutes-15]